MNIVPYVLVIHHPPRKATGDSDQLVRCEKARHRPLHRAVRYVDDLAKSLPRMGRMPIQRASDWAYRCDRDSTASHPRSPSFADHRIVLHILRISQIRQFRKMIGILNLASPERRLFLVVHSSTDIAVVSTAPRPCLLRSCLQHLSGTRSVHHRPRIISNRPSCGPDTLCMPSSLPRCSQSPGESPAVAAHAVGRRSWPGERPPKHLAMRRHGEQVFGAEEKKL